MTQFTDPPILSFGGQQTLRQKAREIIVFEDVEAYTRTQTVRGLPIRHTPLVLMTASQHLFLQDSSIHKYSNLVYITSIMQAYLESQTPTFKSENLPAGWPTNQLASQSVLSLLRLLLKHERGSLRNLVGIFSPLFSCAANRMS
jgi:hypothetical protein